MFTAALLKTAKIWKQLKCPKIDKQTKKQYVEYYSAVSKYEILPFARFGFRYGFS